MWTVTWGGSWSKLKAKLTNYLKAILFSAIFPVSKYWNSCIIEISLLSACSSHTTCHCYVVGWGGGGENTVLKFDLNQYTTNKWYWMYGSMSIILRLTIICSLFCSSMLFKNKNEHIETEILIVSLPLNINIFKAIF